MSAGQKIKQEENREKSKFLPVWSGKALLRELCLISEDLSQRRYRDDWEINGSIKRIWEDKIQSKHLLKLLKVQGWRKQQNNLGGHFTQHSCGCSKFQGIGNKLVQKYSFSVFGWLTGVPSTAWSRQAPGGSSANQRTQQHQLNSPLGNSLSV